MASVSVLYGDQSINPRHKSTTQFAELAYRLRGFLAYQKLSSQADKKEITKANTHFRFQPEIRKKDRKKGSGAYKRAQLPEFPIKVDQVERRKMSWAIKSEITLTNSSKSIIPGLSFQLFRSTQRESSVQ